MNIVEVAKDYATVVNSIVLIVLLLKNMADLRKQRLEHEKLERELRRLRAQDEADRSEILKATAEDIRRYVIEPLAKDLRERDERFDRFQTHLMHEFRDTAAALHSTERSLRSILASQEIWGDLLAIIRKNTEAIHALTKVVERQLKEQDEKNEKS
jgi:hypothetical protein